MAAFENTIAAHYYSGFMEEALYSLMSAKAMLEHPRRKHEDLAEALQDEDLTMCGLHVRHAFLLSATAKPTRQANGVRLWGLWLTAGVCRVLLPSSWRAN